MAGNETTGDNPMTNKPTGNKGKSVKHIWRVIVVLTYSGKKRKVNDGEAGGRRPTKKASRKKKINFEDEVPYAVRKQFSDLFKFAITERFENDDDGFNAALAIEERFEQEVEMVQHELGLKIQSGEQVPVCNLRGVWNLYSPNYLNLREVGSRKTQLATEKHRHYRDWERGTFKIGNEYGEASTFGTDTLGLLHLDGFKNDWRIYLNVPQLATHEVRQCTATAVKPSLARREPSTSEVQVGMYFLGNGYMKIKVPSISLAGPEEWSRHVVLYGVREDV
jgi:hypothetical protein